MASRYGVVHRIEEMSLDHVKYMRVPHRVYLGRAELRELNLECPEEAVGPDGKLASLSHYMRPIKDGTEGVLQIIPVDLESYLSVEAKYPV